MMCFSAAGCLGLGLATGVLGTPSILSYNNQLFRAAIISSKKARRSAVAQVVSLASVASSSRLRPTRFAACAVSSVKEVVVVVVVVVIPRIVQR